MGGVQLPGRRLSAARRCAGFGYGIRKENKKFREFEAMRRAKGGEIPIPAHGLAGRAFLYGTVLCGMGALAGWMLIQYSLGVRNVSWPA